MTKPTPDEVLEMIKEAKALTSGEDGVVLVQLVEQVYREHFVNNNRNWREFCVFTGLCMYKIAENYTELLEKKIQKN